jgi:hypothetical protein
VYLIAVKPFHDNKRNNLEMFNETCILMIGYSLLLMTDYINDSNMKYNIGYILIIITSMNILANLGVIAKETLTQMRKDIPKIKEFFNKIKTKIVGRRDRVQKYMSKPEPIK